jgi:signal transduction histidine kinase
VLGVLREGDAPGTAPAPTLAADLDGLLRRTRAGGQRVTARTDADPESLPPLLSREGYRIVQEGLSNALKHAGERIAVDVRIAVADGWLEITVENPVTGSATVTDPTTVTGPASSRPGGGHGLRGIADRVRLLGGTMTAGAVAGPAAGPAGETWRLHVRLPMKGPA